MDLVVGSFIIGRHRYLFLTWGMIFVCITYFVIKTRKHLQNFTRILNITATFLILISLINIAVFNFPKRTLWQSNKSAKNTETKITTKDLKETDTLPDIYYIILDRYGGRSNLKESYDFDNSDFINYLSNKGFYIASKSRANYLKTAHSLASSLNMEYINYLSDKLGEESNDWRALYVMLQDYKVWRFLKSRGYEFIHFGSFWEPTSKNKYADMNFNLNPSEFLMVLNKTTMIYPICVKFGILDYRMEQWKRVLYKFDKLNEIPNIKKPTFVFVHMLIPHFPYVFDQDGRFLKEEEVNKRSKRENYVNQIVFANKKVKKLIDKLLSKSEIPPIIILQGDEGPFPLRSISDWKQASNMELREKMGILNAYYLPDVDKNVLYPSVTPVNTFRIIFNLYFNGTFKLLSDESYIFPDERHPYKFYRVTDKLK